MNDGNSMQQLAQSALGRYHLIRRIGVGGMGEVWLSEDPALHRQVAIKTLPLHNQNDNDFLQRFEREARAAAALNHPHILPVHDFGKQLLPNGQTITYIVMPYIGGGSLADRIDTFAHNKASMPPTDTLSYLMQSADAMDYAHAQGILHRDIKPANMLLRNDNWLMLADFGIARMLSESTQLTQTGVGFGTPDYMAPEQAQGNAEPASDNYSLAVIAYQLLTGGLPFRGDSSYAITIQHIMTPPPPPRQMNPALSPEIEQLLLLGLAKNPAQRPPSARDFVAALQYAMQQAPFAASPMQSTKSTPFFVSYTKHPLSSTTTHIDLATTPKLKLRRGITRRQVVIGGGAGLLLVGGGIGAWAIASTWKHSGQNQAQATRTTSTQAQGSTAATSSVSAPGSPNFLLTAHDRTVTALAWSPKAPVLASTGLDGNIMLWDVLAIQQKEASTNKAKANQLLGVVGNNMLLAWSPDGAYIAIGNTNGPQTADVFTSAYISIYTGDLSNPLPGYRSLPFTGSNFFTTLTWTPGKHLFAALDGVTASTTKFLLIDTQSGPNPNTKTMLTASVPLSITSDNFNYYLNPMAVSPDGSTIAIGTIDGVTIGQLTVANAALHWKEKALLTFGDTLTNEGNTVTWSPDSRFVAATNEIGLPSVLTFWDLQNNNSRQNLQTPSSDVVLGTLTWSPASTSTKLAAGNKDGTVYIWNVYLGQNVPLGNKLPANELHGPQAQIEALSWSVDGQWLAAAYNDVNNSIAVWNMSQQ